MSTGMEVRGMEGESGNRLKIRTQNVDRSVSEGSGRREWNETEDSHPKCRKIGRVDWHRYRSNAPT